MIRKVLAAALIVLLSSGCTSTRFISVDAEFHERSRLTYVEAQEHLHGEFVRIILRDNREVFGVVSELRPDSVHFLHEDGVGSLALPTRDVLRLESRNHLSGGILGFLGGLMVGPLVGFAVGGISIPRGGDRGLGVLLFALAGAGVGILSGTIYGSIRGMVERYEFQAYSVVSYAP